MEAVDKTMVSQTLDMLHHPLEVLPRVQIKVVDSVMVDVAVIAEITARLLPLTNNNLACHNPLAHSSVIITMEAVDKTMVSQTLDMLHHPLEVLPRVRIKVVDSVMVDVAVIAEITARLLLLTNNNLACHNPLAHSCMEVPTKSSHSEVSHKQHVQQPTTPNPVKKFANWNYCFSCGFDVPDDHTSMTCTMLWRKVGHQQQCATVRGRGIHSQYGWEA
jgi:hypothetical protein